MTTTIADPTLGIRAQARAVLAYLEEYEPDFAPYENGRYRVEIDTRAWYNGRERGISLSVYRHGYDGCLVITFGEHRSSDGIFVDCWTVDLPPWDGPTTADFTEEAYMGRKSFDHGAAGKAAEYIYRRMDRFYRSMKKVKPKEAV